MFATGLAAWTERIAGQEAEDEQHREGDHRPDPNGGEGDLAHRCVHVGETPSCGFVFRRYETDFGGNFVRVTGRTGLVKTEHLFYTDEPPVSRLPPERPVAQTPYAELHCHTNFSFLDGASAPDELVERAVALGLTGLAVTDHNGLYGAVRFVSAAEAVGLHPVVGLEIELLDAAVADPDRIVVPPAPAATPAPRHGRAPPRPRTRPRACPRRPRPTRARLPGHREPVKEDLRGIGERARGPHLVLLARSQVGWRSLCRLVSRANMAGTKGVPRFSQALLAEHTEGLVALSGCRDGELARRLRTGDLAGARAVAERYATLFGRGDGTATSGFFIELSHHLLPDDDWLVAEAAALAEAPGLPVVVTNDVHYAAPEDRELADVLTAIKHGRSLDTLGDLRRPDGESS